jgi:hypothetical protein
LASISLAIVALLAAAVIVQQPPILALALILGVQEVVKCVEAGASQVVERGALKVRLIHCSLAAGTVDEVRVEEKGVSQGVCRIQHAQGRVKHGLDVAQKLWDARIATATQFFLPALSRVDAQREHGSARHLHVSLAGDCARRELRGRRDWVGVYCNLNVPVVGAHGLVLSQQPHLVDVEEVF